MKVQIRCRASFPGPLLTPFHRAAYLPNPVSFSVCISPSPLQACFTLLGSWPKDPFLGPAFCLVEAEVPPRPCHLRGPAEGE